MVNAFFGFPSYVINHLHRFLTLDNVVHMSCQWTITLMNCLAMVITSVATDTCAIIA